MPRHSWRFKWVEEPRDVASRQGEREWAIWTCAIILSPPTPYQIRHDLLAIKTFLVFQMRIRHFEIIHPHHDILSTVHPSHESRIIIKNSQEFRRRKPPNAEKKSFPDIYYNKTYVHPNKRGVKYRFTSPLCYFTNWWQKNWPPWGEFVTTPSHNPCPINNSS